MTILGLELDEWWELIRVVVGVVLMTTVLVFGGLLIHEGTHAFVALCFGCEIVLFRFTGFLGAEIGIYAGAYYIPIVFSGAFAEGLYLLVVRRFIESKGLWTATLACWIYAVVEIFMFMPLLHAIGDLTFVLVASSLMWPRLKEAFYGSDYQESTVDLPVWVPSDRRRNR